jgi:hypothetical protein
VALIMNIIGRKGSLSCNCLSTVDLLVVPPIVMVTITPYCENVAAERYVA